MNYHFMILLIGLVILFVVVFFSTYHAKVIPRTVYDDGLEIHHTISDDMKLIQFTTQGNHGYVDSGRKKIASRDVVPIEFDFVHHLLNNTMTGVKIADASFNDIKMTPSNIRAMYEAGARIFIDASSSTDELTLSKTIINDCKDLIVISTISTGREMIIPDNIYRTLTPDYKILKHLAFIINTYIHIKGTKLYFMLDDNESTFQHQYKNDLVEYGINPDSVLIYTDNNNYETVLAKPCTIIYIGRFPQITIERIKNFKFSSADVNIIFSDFMAYYHYDDETWLWLKNNKNIKIHAMINYASNAGYDVQETYDRYGRHVTPYIYTLKRALDCANSFTSLYRSTLSQISKTNVLRRSPRSNIKRERSTLEFQPYIIIFQTSVSTYLYRYSILNTYTTSKNEILGVYNCILIEPTFINGDRVDISKISITLGMKSINKVVTFENIMFGDNVYNYKAYLNFGTLDVNKNLSELFTLTTNQLSSASRNIYYRFLYEYIIMSIAAYYIISPTFNINYDLLLTDFQYGDGRTFTAWDNAVHNVLYDGELYSVKTINDETLYSTVADHTESFYWHDFVKSVYVKNPYVSFSPAKTLINELYIILSEIRDLFSISGVLLLRQPLIQKFNYIYRNQFDKYGDSLLEECVVTMPDVNNKNWNTKHGHLFIPSSDKTTEYSFVHHTLTSDDPNWILIVVATKYESNELLEKHLRPQDRLLYCGVGKINATHKLSAYLQDILRTNKKLPFVLNIGAAGSSKLQIGTIVECIKIIQHDMDAVGLGYNLTETPGEILGQVGSGVYEIPVLYNKYDSGICYSGDQFVTTSHVINNVGGADVYDMEAYAYAGVCYRCGAGFCSIKYITNNLSDIGDEWNPEISDMNQKFIEIYTEAHNLSLPSNNIYDTKTQPNLTSLDH